MEKRCMFVNSGTSQVLEYLKSNFVGSLFLIEDLTLNLKLTYTSIRSILCHLCINGVILRVCRGVYFYPFFGHTNVYPTVIEVLFFLSSKGNYMICPTGDYLEYCLGIREVLPTKITCYTTGKQKILKLYDETEVRLVPRKRHVFMETCSWHIMLLAQYIVENNFTVSLNKTSLIRYIKNHYITDRDIISLPQEISKKILELLQF